MGHSDVMSKADFVGRLRKKLGVNMIHTVRGLGYKLAAPEEGEEGESIPHPAAPAREGKV